MDKQEKAILVLEDGTTFHGIAIGKKGKAIGEVVFNTGMTGYQEGITNPANIGKMIVFTVPHVGNYGTREQDTFSNKVYCDGIIVKNFSKVASRATSTADLQTYLEENNTTGISGVDTRKLTRHLRENGSMKGIISSEGNEDEETLMEELHKQQELTEEKIIQRLGEQKETLFPASGEKKYQVALVDFGSAAGIVKRLTARGCEVKVFPMTTTMENIQHLQPQGIVLSDGPGNPNVMTQSLALTQEIVNASLPVFGMGMGHELLALTQGAKIEKLKQGHRGLNHPVIRHANNKGEITTQNHSYIVNRESAEDTEELEITHSHLNDNTIQGLSFKNKPIFSVQYNAEAAVGAEDSLYLFDDFIQLM